MIVFEVFHHFTILKTWRKIYLCLFSFGLMNSPWLGDSIMLMMSLIFNPVKLGTDWSQAYFFISLKSHDKFLIEGKKIFTCAIIQDIKPMLSRLSLKWKKLQLLGHTSIHSMSQKMLHKVVTERLRMRMFLHLLYTVCKLKKIKKNKNVLFVDDISLLVWIANSFWFWFWLQYEHHIT